MSTQNILSAEQQALVDKAEPIKGWNKVTWDPMPTRNFMASYTNPAYANSAVGRTGMSGGGPFGMLKPYEIPNQFNSAVTQPGREIGIQGAPSFAVNQLADKGKYSGYIGGFMVPDQMQKYGNKNPMNAIRKAMVQKPVLQ